jgi:hypothetical protein
MTSRFEDIFVPLVRERDIFSFLLGELEGRALHAVGDDDISRAVRVAVDFPSVSYRHV